MKYSFHIYSLRMAIDNLEQRQEKPVSFPRSPVILLPACLSGQIVLNWNGAKYCCITKILIQQKNKFCLRINVLSVTKHYHLLRLPSIFSSAQSPLGHYFTLFNTETLLSHHPLVLHRTWNKCPLHAEAVNMQTVNTSAKWQIVNQRSD